MEGLQAGEPYWLSPRQGVVFPRIGTLKASAIRTQGSFELIEYSGPAAPPPHVHRMREEAFYILDGRFHFMLADDAFDAAAGSFIFVPRGTRRGFTVGPGGRALLLVIPAGLEGFF